MRSTVQVVVFRPLLSRISRHDQATTPGGTPKSGGEETNHTVLNAYSRSESPTCWANWFMTARRITYCESSPTSLLLSRSRQG